MRLARAAAALVDSYSSKEATAGHALTDEKDDAPLPMPTRFAGQCFDDLMLSAHLRIPRIPTGSICITILLQESTP